MPPEFQPAALRRADGIDLLQFRWVRRVVLSRCFPGAIQLITLGVLILLIVVSWGRFAPAGASRAVFANCHLGTLVIWGFWWPMVIWSTVLLGRVWCMICPLELVGAQSERVAARLGWTPRPLPRWIAAGSVALMLYIAVQFLIAVAAINRVPAYTAYLMVALIVVAFIVGLIWRDRAFCRGFCPVGQLLGLYGRGGMLAVRGNGSSNNGCQRKCPSLLDPAKLASNQHCLLCARCLRPGAAAPGPSLFVRRLFSAADVRPLRASWPLTVLVMMESGFVLAELAENLPALGPIFFFLPRWFWRNTGLFAYARHVSWLWTMVLVPLALWLAVALLVRFIGRGGGITECWRRLALPAAVLVSFLHMANAVGEWNFAAGFLPYALQDPGGLVTLDALAEQRIRRPELLLPISLITWVSVGLGLIGLWFAIREGKLARPPRPTTTVPGRVPAGAVLAAGH